MLSPENMFVMFQELANSDRISHEDAVLAVEGDLGGAEAAIRKVLLELDRSKRPVTKESCKVMAVAWELLGRDNCLNRTFLAAEQTSFATFIIDQLRRDPRQFSEDNLARLEVPTSSADLLSAVRLARIAHIKDEAQRLRKNPNELTSDLKEVQKFVSTYNFPPMLNDLLDKVQAEFGKGDGFDQKAMMGHLRTFFEKLHEHVAMVLHVRKPETKDGTDLTKCQQVIDYLERKDVLSKKAQSLGRVLYGILSEEGVHALESTREYVRLCRNMIAEYGLILFYELDRRLAE